MKEVEASRSALWTPVLDGSLAERAREAIQVIAQRLWQRPACGQNDVRTKGAEDASLDGGRAGLAIFYAYLVQAGLTDNAEEKASAFLNEAIDAVAAMPMEPSLYGGFTGIAWSMAHLRGFFDIEDDATEAIDGELRDYLSRKPWHHDYDLVSGLVGFGVYALEQLPSRLASECLKNVVNRLAEITQHTPDGITWFTAPELLPDGQREICPKGYYNLGLAHGVPGVIAFLGRVCALRDKAARSVSAAIRAKARALLDGAVAWLLAQKLVKNKSSVFPAWIAPGITPQPTRVAWCYGDLGIAVALLLAAHCVKEATWEKEALKLARNVAGRPPEQSGVKDCGLCHGAAGVGHLFNRLFQATGETFLKNAARYWFQRTLEMRRPGEGIAGFPMFRRDPDGAERWIAEPGILEGEAGIALALLAAVTDIRPEWDRMMLVSGQAMQR